MVTTYETVGQSPVNGREVYVFPMGQAGRGRYGAWCRGPHYSGDFIDSEGRLCGPDWTARLNDSACDTPEEAYERCLLHLGLPIPKKKSILEQALEVAEGW